MSDLTVLSVVRGMGKLKVRWCGGGSYVIKGGEATQLERNGDSAVRVRRALP